MSAQRIVIELVARAPLSSRVHRLAFRALAPFRWAAGQHLVVVGGQGQELFLPYSIASAYNPGKPGQFELAVTIGAGATVMDELPLGAQLEILGPEGELTWQPSPRPAALLVGVGTGIAPLRALIEEELARPSDIRLLLLAGHRELEDCLFADDFARLASLHPRFRFVTTLSGVAADWGGPRGRVQAHLTAAVSSLGLLDAYVCGRLDMVREVVALLETCGVTSPQVRSEGY